MTKHKHDNIPSTAALAYKKLGSIVFLCGFLVGAIGAGGLLFAEMTKMNKSLFEALAGDSAITFSLIAAFMVPLSIGWVARYMISGQRY
jgi:hypothetical protein